MDGGKTDKQKRIDSLSERLNNVASDYLKNSTYVTSNELKDLLDQGVIEFMKDEVRAQVQLSGKNTVLAGFFKDVTTFKSLQEGIKTAKGKLDESGEAKTLLKNLETLAESCEGISNTIGELSSKIADIKGKENFSWGENIARFTVGMIFNAIPKILGGVALVIEAAVMCVGAIASYFALGFAGMLAGTVAGAAAGPVGMSVGGAAGALGGAVVGGAVAYVLGGAGLMFGEDGANLLVDGVNTFCKQFRIDNLEKSENDQINLSQAKVALEKFIEETVQPNLLTEVANSIQESAKAAELSANKVI